MTETKEIATTPQRFQEQQGALSTYSTTEDIDAKAQLLNNSLVIKNDQGVANPESVRLVMTLLDEEENQRLQYRPDAITALTSDNLVSIANSMAGASFYERGVEEQRSRIIEVAARIQKTTDPLLKSRQTVWSQGLTEVVSDEIAERLMGDTGDPRETEEILRALDEYMTPELLGTALKDNVLLVALLMRVQEFNDPEIRKAILSASAEAIRKEDN